MIFQVHVSDDEAVVTDFDSDSDSEVEDEAAEEEETTEVEAPVEIPIAVSNNNNKFTPRKAKIHGRTGGSVKRRSLSVSLSSSQKRTKKEKNLKLVTLSKSANEKLEQLEVTKAKLQGAVFDLRLRAPNNDLPYGRSVDPKLTHNS